MYARSGNWWRGWLGALAVSSVLWAVPAVAKIMSFTPAGISTVGLDNNLYWDMRSDRTSTTSAFSPYEFWLYKHGAIQFNRDFADVSGYPEFGNPGDVVVPIDYRQGELIDGSSRWAEQSLGWVGTWNFGGGCQSGEPRTCIYGISLQIGAKTHYGWVQFLTPDFPLMDATQSLLGWAYETIPEKGIAAGAVSFRVAEPAALAIFGLGLAGLGFAIRRRRAV